MMKKITITKSKKVATPKKPVTKVKTPKKMSMKMKKPMPMY